MDHAQVAVTPAADSVKVSGLTVAYRSKAGWLQAVRDVSFDLKSGEILAIVGETGSGKSSTATAMIRMLPSNGKVLAGQVFFEGKNLLELPDREMRRLRGESIAYVPQQPTAAFNPTMTVGRQVAEPLVIHRGMKYKQAAPEAARRLREMGVHEVARVMRSYPHELSGGMLQRAMIATAMICEPSLIIADEPTSALDVTIQRQILKLIKDVQRNYRLALLLISHDLKVVSQIADRILVLYGGRAAEIGPTDAIINRPRHPYTHGLLQSTMAREVAHKGKLASLAGYPPNPVEVDKEPGCPFRPRCARAVEDCAVAFPAETGDRNHHWACYNPEPQA